MSSSEIDEFDGNAELQELALQFVNLTVQIKQERTRINAMAKVSKELKKKLETAMKASRTHQLEVNGATVTLANTLEVKV